MREALQLSHNLPPMASESSHYSSNKKFIILATRHNSVYLHIIPRLSADALFEVARHTEHLKVFELRAPTL